jgi:DNA (cytosine-5)-methyltransferase 1
MKASQQIKSVYSIDGLSPTLDTAQGGHRQVKILESAKVRKLTPLECFRLMGFDDASYHRAATVSSKTQLYKQAGNSIVVDVLEELFRMMLDESGEINV